MEFKMEGSSFYGKKITYGKKGVNSPLKENGSGASEMKEAKRPSKSRGLEKQGFRKMEKEKMDRPGAKESGFVKESTPSWKKMQGSSPAGRPSRDEKGSPEPSQPPKRTMTDKPTKKTYTQEGGFSKKKYAGLKDMRKKYRDR
jgi:hypothetical protein